MASERLYTLVAACVLSLAKVLLFNVMGKFLNKINATPPPLFTPPASPFCAFKATTYKALVIKRLYLCLQQCTRYMRPLQNLFFSVPFIYQSLKNKLSSLYEP